MLILAVLSQLAGCLEPRSELEQVLKSGEIKILTRNDPTTYYEDADGKTGFEYDLVMLFAEHLDVQPRFIVPDTFMGLLQMLALNEANFAAAGLTITPSRKQLFNFTPSYYKVTQQLIYHKSRIKPRDLNHLERGILEVVAGSSHAENLRQLKLSNPDLDWYENDEESSEELVQSVNEGLIDYTISDSNQSEMMQGMYPDLRVAFDISKPESIAWAFPKTGDSSLYLAAVRFLNEIKSDGTLKYLIEKHFSHTRAINYVGNCTFRKHIKQRLPDYINFFKAAAKKHQLDWKLLAAMGYQESHWDKDARSPTGVRGIMMLTQSTARMMEIKDRTDPKSSIDGGAKYLIRVRDKIPDRIAEPDRTWMALASYNVGFGHLEDARKLTKQLGGDPDKWADVKQRLPLLSKKKWHSKTRHGYARGNEPVTYVENIRSYYDILSWLVEQKQEKPLDNQAIEFYPPAI